jgi:hypothetical protein
MDETNAAKFAPVLARENAPPDVLSATQPG